MTKNRKTKSAKRGAGYKLFRQYLRFIHSYLYYRKTYWVDKENIPKNCPLMIISDHQNGLADPLGILMSPCTRKNRKIHLVARASVFKPILKRIMSWLGVLPAFRLSYDGEESLANNNETFNIAEEELLNDGTVVIYPEAGHQDKRWLGKFSHGYLRIIFEAAEKSSFKKEVFILPSCNHYSSYVGMREQMLIKYGKPISAAPYYELYKTKPRTAQRQLNAAAWQQVSDLMLNITDNNSYEPIDYLRNTYGIGYAKIKGYNPNVLPEKLLADKQLVAELDAAKSTNEEQVLAIYSNAEKLDDQTKQLRISSSSFGKKYSCGIGMLEGLLLTVLFPLFIFACIPNIIAVYAPRIITSKIQDKLQHSGIAFAFNALIAIPVSYLAMFFSTWIVTKSLPISLTYLGILPFLGIFAWHYGECFKSWKNKLRFHKLQKKGTLKDLELLRNTTYKSLDTLLNIEVKR